MQTIEQRPINAACASFRWPSDTHPVLRQVLERRPLSSLSDLNLSLNDIVPVGRFAALPKAVELLMAHKHGHIVIVGDFDSDGATSTALMRLVLERLGFTSVSYFIPDRFELGYGLSPEAVARILPRAPSLLVTVDNGISSVAGVAAARAAGVDVLITDHHVPPDVLPSANVVINPNLRGSTFDGKNLAGVGVAFYLLAALAKALDAPHVVADYLDLVALGTVADLVPLDRLNRILVEQGIRRIRAGRCRPGILALCESAGIDYRESTTTALAYQVAPRLNAAGRLDDMSIGVRCLVCAAPNEARRLATQLDELNTQRRALERRMRAEAFAQIDSADDIAIDSQAPVICMYDHGWHEGLVGLIASRIKDRCNRPTFAFARSADGTLKGSGRSIRGFHLRDALACVDAAQPGMIERFGGHAMAAGLTLRAECLEQFTSLLLEIGSRELTSEQLTHRILTDGSIEPQHMTLDVARLLRTAAPWGQAFPEPLFDGRFQLIERRWLKDAHLKMVVKPDAGAAPLDAIFFNCPSSTAQPGDTLRLAYRLGVNDYYAEHRVQLLVEHIEPPTEPSR